MNDNLLRFNNSQKYIVLDTETESLNLVNSRPWQAAWILAEGKQIKSKHSHFIKWPNLNVSEGAAKVTGFSMEKYERLAEDPTVVFNKLKPYLYNPEYKIIGQNLLGFDVYMINIWRKAIGLKSDYSFIERIIDTKSIAAAIFKNIWPDKNNFTSWQYKLLHVKEKGLKTSQLTLLKHYGISFDQNKLHDALYDIEMNFDIFLKQIYDIEI